MLTIIIAILVFCLLITAHEFGHFITAKLCGVTVHEFAIGMGPAIFKKQGRETLYSIRAIPVGGYCKMEGEDSDSVEEGSFNTRKKWQKIIILAAGAIMNIITGYLVLVIIMFQTAGIRVPVVDKVMDGYPAAEVLQAGDEIFEVNGKRVYTNVELSVELAETDGEVELLVKRGNEKFEAVIVPKADESGRLLVGIECAYKTLGVGDRFFYAYRNTLYYSKLILKSFGDLITGKVGLNNLSGPAGIVSEIGNAAQTSQEHKTAVPLLDLIAFITINLGVFNLLPIPALDGGRIFFVVVSAIIRKEIPPEKEGIVHFIGLILLFALMLFATGNDILRIFKR